MDKPFLFHNRNSPILFSIPHDGAFIPNQIAKTMHEYALKTPDRDKFVSQLYSFAKDFDISLLKSHISRFVIDLNRPNDNSSMYENQTITQLCPMSLFDQRPIYKNSELELDATEIDSRIKSYWKPYHQVIKDKLELIHQQHGYAILIDCHSIKSKVPRFFEGTLPAINIGTNSGESCSKQIQSTIEALLKNQKHYSYVINDRFKGGYITRHYGQPEKGIHAIQIELSQATYMDESEEKYDLHKAEKLKTILIRIINSLIS